jgi:hypothetical protein
MAAAVGIMVCTYVITYVCCVICVRMVYTYVCMYVCMSVRMHICTNVYTHVFTYVRTYTYVLPTYERVGCCVRMCGRLGLLPTIALTLACLWGYIYLPCSSSWYLKINCNCESLSLLPPALVPLLTISVHGTRHLTGYGPTYADFFFHCAEHLFEHTCKRRAYLEL